VPRSTAPVPFLAAALALCACDGDKPTQLDLLFVIDSSGSTREEQLALGAAMPALLAHLERGGGLPNTNIGVVSADMGAGPTTLGPCRPLGDRGALQVRPGCGLDSATGNWFLRAGGGRKPNFTGTPAEALDCLVQLGVGGCGFEQHLGSLVTALAPSELNLENVGFLRGGALLAVVILADEDDCTMDGNATFFTESRPGQGGSLRCATSGHDCGGQPVPAQAGFTAPLSSCEPHRRTAAELNTHLVGLPGLVDFLKRLKARQEQMLFVATIIGWSDDPGAQYRIVDRGPPPELQLDAICASPQLGAAAPALRLHSFARSFQNHAIHSVCAADLMAPMDDIGKRLAGLLQ
jgi:hypothetical protein